MRTTLAIDDDVLAAAKALAAQRRRSVGEVISDLARASLRQARSGQGEGARNGVPLLAKADNPVTLEIIHALRDEAP